LKLVRLFIGIPYQGHISAAEAAIDATSADLAVEEGPHGIRSNVIAPGPIDGTEGMDRLLHIGKGTTGLVPTSRKGGSRMLPMQ